MSAYCILFCVSCAIIQADHDNSMLISIQTVNFQVQELFVTYLNDTPIALRWHKKKNQLWCSSFNHPVS